jgi:4'-phosphopantetheinyl transferase
VSAAIEAPRVSGTISLAHDEVHTWWARLDVPAWRIRQLARTLAPEEVVRANCFRAQRVRDRWIVGRGLLRELLGQYIGCEPASIQLAYGTYGKPVLAPNSGDARLRFNVSHTEGLVLFGLARDHDLGVDVETIRPLKDLDLIAEQFFSLQERAALRSLRTDQQLAGFFNCWTRKEAYVKAVGLGLSHSLDSFDVELTPGRPSRLLAIDGDSAKAVSWSLTALQAPPGFAAALAVPGQIHRFKRHSLESR